jgi:hypothetical protein
MQTVRLESDTITGYDSLYKFLGQTREPSQPDGYMKLTVIVDHRHITSGLDAHRILLLRS